ncbi:sperm acrosome membrane-associated protein 6 isoform X2 [Orcinus orca]|uniref:sperm acrosome membrane-associated protein 6 isoform X2 n=1 Tax=Orcinus orca TaxID=9733 RepID=UPI002112AE70|nr:sperm acrosome membrane-associated protein 6 isoform X2 [Orcinus orca]
METSRGPETQRREDRGFAGARDGRTEALRGPEAQRREDRGFAGARGSETGGQRLCGGQRREDRGFAGARDSETGGQRLCRGQRREDRDFAGARGSETGGQRLCGGQRREDRDFAGARGSETGGQRLCGGQRLRDGRTEALQGPEAQREAEEGPLWGCGVGEPLRPSSCLRPPDYEERSHLHDAFTQMTHSLQEVAAAQGSFQVAFPHAAEKMQKIILQLKEVQACIRPCGLQEVARRFRCRGCYSTVCDLPLDCPGLDGDSGSSGYVLLHCELPAA